MDLELKAAESVLHEAQSEILAYYKKGFSSNHSYPPLRYFIQVLKRAPEEGQRPDALASYFVLPDVLFKAPDSVPALGRMRGIYFEIGFGWLYPTAAGALRLLLRPRQNVLIRRTYRLLG